MASRLGIKRLIAPETTPESSLKKSLATKGRPKPPGFGAKVAAGKLGKPLSDAHKQAMARGLKGRVPTFLGRHHSQESIKKMSDGKMGSIPWNRGIARTPEEKSKMSEHSVGILGRPSKGFEYNGQYYRSGWEKDFAESLDYLHVSFRYEAKTFLLTRSNGSKTSYTPDFLVNETWVEIKGLMYRNSAEVMALFQEQYPNEELIIIRKRPTAKLVESQVLDQKKVGCF
jgi:hypothetical protein